MDIEKVIKQVNEIERGLKEQLDSPDDLSMSIGRLAIAYSVLGNALVAAEDEVRQMEAELKYTQSKRVRELTSPSTEMVDGKEVPIKGMSVGLAERVAVEESRAKILLYLTAKKNKDLLSIKRADIKLLVDALRTRVSFIKEEIK